MHGDETEGQATTRGMAGALSVRMPARGEMPLSQDRRYRELPHKPHHAGGAASSYVHWPGASDQTDLRCANLHGQTRLRARAGPGHRGRRALRVSRRLGASSGTGVAERNRMVS